MTQPNSRYSLSPLFVRGALDSMPFFIVLAPFAMLFGVIGTDAGLNLIQVLSFSVLVIAGSAQLTAVQLLTEQTPTLIVIVTALAVNLRMAMYSAALAPHLGAANLWTRAIAAYCLYDQPYALSTLKFETHPEYSLKQKLQYFFGTAVPLGITWWVATLSGALLGEKLPTNIGVEIAIPITFLASVAPLLRTPAHIAAAITSASLIIVLRDFPNGPALLASAAAALLVGAGVEILMEKRGKRS